MLKKLLLVIILAIVLLAGLQLFGGRDFGQIPVALDKYNMHGKVSTFMSDVWTIFKGEKVAEGILPNSRYADQVLYRWTDELGQVHVSERMPDVKEFEAIRMGDMKFQVEEGMTTEQVKEVLKQGKKD